MGQLSDKLRGLQPLYDALEPEPNTIYGDVLPLAKNRETGEYRAALPNTIRDAALGLVDLLQGTRTGELTARGALAMPLPGLAAGTMPRGAFGSLQRWPIATRSGRVMDMPLRVNPTMTELRAAVKNNPQRQVRMLRDPNTGDVYAWEAAEAMHVDVADTLDLPFRNRAELQANSYLFGPDEVEELAKPILRGR